MFDDMRDFLGPTQLFMADGNLIDLENISAADIHLDHIIGSLCWEQRFAGQLDKFYTVGHHTMAMFRVGLAMNVSGSTLRTILLHDMHEFITGDIPSPVKRLLGPEIKALEARIDKAIFEKFAHIPTPDGKEMCAKLDSLLWQAELSIMGKVTWPGEMTREREHCLTSVRMMMSIPMVKMAELLDQTVRREFAKEEVMQ